MTILITLLMTVAQADDWICKDESSFKSGNTIHACGIGMGTTEDLARNNAFQSAENEFKRVCFASDDCRSHGITVEPKRTTCDSDQGQTKCYRMVVFTIGEKRQQNAQGILRKGMTKQEVLDAFGTPYDVSDIGFYYNDDRCISRIEPCIIWFQDGKVSSMKWIKPEFMEL